MRISKKEDLLQQVKKNDQVIIYGGISLIRIALRCLKKEGLSDKVAAVSISGRQKKEGTVLDCPISPMASLAASNRDVFVLVVHATEEREEDTLLFVDRLGFKNVAVIEYDLLSELGAQEHVHLDFLCVGFVKCGTSSLHAALKKNKAVFLPKKKETLYMGWRKRFDNAPELFNSIYFNNVPKGRIVGNVEPSYHANANGVYECYGKDTKIIFMVRNPVSATFSYFKMLMRKSVDIQQVNYYKKYKKFDVRMFDDYISDYILSQKDTRFCYMDWIDQYLRYYDKENIKVVIFEELIKNPEQVMDDIQDFIGVDKMKFESLPHSNEGKSVSKNYISARINRHLYFKDIALRSEKSDEVKKRHNTRKEKLLKHTLVDNQDKMPDSCKETLNIFYKESIQRLEEFCGKSLEGIWY